MFNWFFVASLVIILPAMIALFKFGIMDKAFKPLAYNLWIGVGAEIVANIFRVTIHNNLYVMNVFMLLDFLTFVWMLDNWGAFTRFDRNFRKMVLTVFLLLWITDNLVVHHLGENNILFRICYSLFLVLVGINQFSTVMLKNNGYLSTNPFLYITLGIIFYYTYSIFIGLFNSPFFEPSTQLWKWNMLIYVVVNVMTNILFAISFLWIRKKVRYI